MLTLNNIPLPLPTRQIIDQVERDFSLQKLAILFNRSWPGFGTVGLANATHYRPWPPQPLRINHVYWPTGASRYAFGALLCDSGTADELHDSIFGPSGIVDTKRDLVLS